MSRLTRSRIARYRVDAGFSTAEKASEKLKVSRIYLLEIEEGRKNPSPALVERMAKTYKVGDTAIRRAVRDAQRDLLERKLKQLNGSS